ncbi:MAG: hypothetical protein RJA07_2498 [Bacteroidota bacterium]|jgi:uncharacterized repeat protein (TIGR01451 family)
MQTAFIRLFFACTIVLTAALSLAAYSTPVEATFVFASDSTTSSSKAKSGNESSNKNDDDNNDDDNNNDNSCHGNTCSTSSKFIFTLVKNTPFDTKLTDSWTSNWVDYDNDGYDDLFIPERNASKPNYLYHNNKNGTFTQVLSGSIVKDKGISTSATFADVDNDGFIDALVVNDTKTSNFYYKNVNKIFTRDKSKPFATTNAISYYHNASWVDFDRDGKLDLFLCNYFDTKFNEMYHNDGNGNFSKVGAGDITLDKSDAVGATWADYDNDGYQDLFIPSNNPLRKNALYHNDGNNHFTKITTGIVVTDGGYSVASCWGDYNNDGKLDLFVCNTTGISNYLYKNLGNGNFQKITTGAIATDASASHGCSFADIDNDGDLDIYVTADAGKNFLYINNGNETFTANKTEKIVTLVGKSFGHSWSDYDKDGFLDLFVTTHGNQRDYLFHNNATNNNRWVNIRLVGTVSNKSAIGAKVRVKSNGKWQVREVNCQSGLGGQSSLAQHFGLKNASRIDSIQIIWPSGYVQSLINQMVDKFLVITEDKGVLLKGKVYYDANNNCKQDANEVAIPNQTITLNPGNIKVVTNDAGVYNVYVSKGKKTISFNNNATWVSSCVNSVSFNVNNLSATVADVNFALRANCNKPDLAIEGGTTALKRGFKNIYKLKIYNNGGANSSNYVVKFTIPTNQISIKSTTPAFASTYITGNKKTYVWNMAAGINIGGNFEISIIDSVNRLATLKDSVVTKAEVVYETECNKNNNIFTDKNFIVGSYDPNMMVVSPEGEGTEGLIKATDTLTYKIMFQNFGNDSASFVDITDTLPENIDLSTFQFKSSSHKCTYNIGDDRILQIHFDNINLPYASIDEASSNGYFSFYAKPISNIQGGSAIVNQSIITFDYNDAIATNKVKNTIYSYQANEEKHEVFMFPNPTSDYTNLVLPEGTFDNATKAEILVYNISGKLINQLNWDNLATNHYQLPTNSLETGLYQVIVATDTKKVFANKLQVVHP